MWTEGRIFKGDPFSWLLERDPINPGVRFFALRDLFELADDDPEVQDARRSIMDSGPVPRILAHQEADGGWDPARHGLGYEYCGTVWQVIFLAELGADPAERSVKLACEHVLASGITGSGGFACGDQPPPSRVVHCVNGQVVWALVQHGYAWDERVQGAIEWLCRSATGKGDTDYYESGTSGPEFACGQNEGQPCAWGAAKSMRALTSLPEELHSDEANRVLELGAEILLGHDPATADCPFTGRVRPMRFEFGFPLGCWSDVIEVVHLLGALGRGSDPRLISAEEMILAKQDDEGRWQLESSLNGQMWVDIEADGEPSKWTTLRALRAMKLAAHGPEPRSGR